MATRSRQLNSDRPPTRAAVIVTAFAAAAALAALLLGLAIFAIDLTPDTGQYENFGVSLATDWLFQFLYISGFFGVGAGIWSLALVSGRWRLIPGAVIVLALVGLGFGIAAQLI